MIDVRGRAELYKNSRKLQRKRKPHEQSEFFASRSGAMSETHGNYKCYVFPPRFSSHVMTLSWRTSVPSTFTVFLGDDDLLKEHLGAWLAVLPSEIVIMFMQNTTFPFSLSENVQSQATCPKASLVANSDLLFPEPWCSWYYFPSTSFELGTRPPLHLSKIIKYIVDPNTESRRCEPVHSHCCSSQSDIALQLPSSVAPSR